MIVMDKLISVIVPVYNGIATLEKCIKSIENQNYKNIQIIIIDDGSTDGSVSLEKQLETQYANVTVTTLAHGGVSAARNKGIDLAEGEYISFIDCDDEIHPEMYEVMENEISNNGAELAVVGIERVDNGERAFVPYSVTEKFYTANPARLLLKPLWFNSASNKLYKADIIKEKNVRFDDNVKIGEDFLFNAEYAKYAGKTAVISRPMYTYNMNGVVLRPSSDTRRLEAVKLMYNAIEPFTKDDKELEQAVRVHMYNEYLFALRLFCMSYYSFNKKVDIVKEVLASREYRAVKDAHDNVPIVYRLVLATNSALMICMYLERGKWKIKR